MNLTVILIMIAVLIVLPILFARLSGQNPMEMFFGRRVNDTVFAAKKAEKTEKVEAKQPTEKNSTKNDLLVLISHLTSYARRNRFYLIVPGTLTLGGRTAVLTAVLVTRNAVVGVNCFGFGGDVNGKSGQTDWTQTMNGQRTSFASPVRKNEDQEKLLAAILKDAGFSGVRTKVVGVFTAPKVRLTNVSGTGCYDMEGMKKILSSDEFLTSEGLEPSEIGKKLEAYVKRVK